MPYWVVLRRNGGKGWIEWVRIRDCADGCLGAMEEECVIRATKDFRDALADGAHVFRGVASGGEGGGAETDTGWVEWFSWIVRNRVEVHGYPDSVEGLRGDAPRGAEWGDVHEEEVVVGASGDKPAASGRECFSECAGIFNNALRIGAEFGLCGLVERCRNCGGLMVMRSPLESREYGAIDERGEMVARAFGRRFQRIGG